MNVHPELYNDYYYCNCHYYLMYSDWTHDDGVFTGPPRTPALGIAVKTTAAPSSVNEYLFI